jgi:hypothetical protein
MKTSSKLVAIAETPEFQAGWQEMVTNAEAFIAKNGVEALFSNPAHPSPELARRSQILK